jgi:hypothetical protein
MLMPSGHTVKRVALPRKETETITRLLREDDGNNVAEEV